MSNPDRHSPRVRDVMTTEPMVVHREDDAEPLLDAMPVERKARVAARNGENAGVGRDLADATDIGRGQRCVELLRGHVGADEEFSAVVRRHDLVLLSPGEIRPGGAVRRTMPCESRFITVSPFAFGV